jgi:predicted amidohydrolase
MTKIEIVQLKVSTDKNKNLKKILHYISKAAKHGADICAFPEFMMFYTKSSQTPRQLANAAESINGNFVTEIANAAKQNSIMIVGTLYEKSTKKNRVYDTCFLVSQNGKITRTYRKIHLFDALGFKESDKMVAGSKIALPLRTKIGTLGMLICYDLRFPEMSRNLALAGSEILFVPSAWIKGPFKEEHWLTFNKTRAIENGCYLIAPDQVGNIYCGRSLVVNPYGKILLDMKRKEGIGFVDISLQDVYQTRKKLPLLKNRRPKIYSKFKS